MAKKDDGLEIEGIEELDDEKKYLIDDVDKIDKEHINKKLDEKDNVKKKPQKTYKDLSPENLLKVATLVYIDGVSWDKSAKQVGLSVNSLYNMRRAGSQKWKDAMKAVSDIFDVELLPLAKHVIKIELEKGNLEAAKMVFNMDARLKVDIQGEISHVAIPVFGNVDPLSSKIIIEPEVKDGAKALLPLDEDKSLLLDEGDEDGE